MPSSDHYLPRASRAPRLGAGAVLEYEECGWTITEFGRVDPGTVTGPCGRCRAPCVRYGPNSTSTLCDQCRDKTRENE